MASKIITEKPLWRGKKSPKIVQDDNDDCGSLAWLLNFRLDEIVNVKVPDDDSQEGYIIPEELPAQRKPPYTYPELIERALRERGELTVSAIYQWISDRFPYYKANDERWKNSVRHNLSINPHFRKGARAPQGAGHLWSLAPNAIDLLPRRSPVPEEEKKRPYEEAQILDFPKGVRIATMARGGGRMWSVCGPKPESPPAEQPTRKKHYEEANILDFPKVIVLDEAAIAAASILPDQEVFSGSTMFLNPISSEQVVRECGLLVVD